MSKFDALDWYDTPLYYDIVFSGDDAREGAFLLAALERFGPKLRGAPRVLEPACGSGRLVLELARRGCSVTGFDLSAPMLAFARQRLRRGGARAELFEARLEEFRVAGAFDLAHCLVNTFKYLLDEDAVQAHLACVARALRPGGLYVLGLHLTQYEDRRCNHERWEQARDGVRVVCNIRGWPPAPKQRLERVRSRLAVLERGRERRTQSEWSFRTYDWRELVRSLERSGSFELVATFDFDYEIASPRTMPDDLLDVVLVLRKRATKRTKQ